MGNTCDKRIVVGEGNLQELSKEVYNVFGSYCKAAKALGLSYTEFWRLCNGKRKSVSEATFDKMCDILQIDKNKLNFNILEPIETRFTLRYSS
jgi:transcriptional regulator with XRE-family HTH domain